MTADAIPAKTPASPGAQPGAHESSIYELFMGLMTVSSLAVMALLLFAKQPQIDAILLGVDTLFCILFLFDFVRSLRHAPVKRDYLFGEHPGRSVPHGLIDLLGSIPAAGLFRALRIFRLARVARLVRARGAKGLVKEFLARRAESAVYIIVTASMFVLLFGSLGVAYIEPSAEGSNIKTGGDAFWWAFVTITTVGYGDRFPVTGEGRLIGMLTMGIGIGIFGVLTSFLSSLFLAPPAPDEEEAPAEAAPAAPAPQVQAAAADASLAAEVAALRADIAALRTALANDPAGGTPGG